MIKKKDVKDNMKFFERIINFIKGKFNFNKKNKMIDVGQNDKKLNENFLSKKENNYFWDNLKVEINEKKRNLSQKKSEIETPIIPQCGLGFDSNKIAF